MSAVSSATTPAVQSALDPVDVINTPAGQPAQERYPGAVDPSAYDWGHQEAGSTKGGPIPGSWGGNPFISDIPQQAPGGGYQDTSWATGHNGPQADWDSSAGRPFAPSGAVDPELHSGGTGAVFVKEYVVPAEIGKLTRRTMTGQTTVRSGSGDQTVKDNATSPNGRADLDQQQWHNPDGFDPWEIPYAERPVLNNLAYESTGITAENSVYTPSGAIPDRSVYDYSAEAYEGPPDPYVGTSSATASSDSGIGGGWV